MLGVTVSGGGVSTPYTSWFMFILCEFFAVPGREGPGGARAGGEESSVFIIVFLKYSWQMFRIIISQNSLTTVPSASLVEGSRRSGVIRMQNALVNATLPGCLSQSQE